MPCCSLREGYRLSVVKGQPYTPFKSDPHLGIEMKGVYGHQWSDSLTTTLRYENGGGLPPPLGEPEP